MAVGKLVGFYAMIERLEWSIGRLLEALRQLPAFADNTLKI